MPSLTFDVEMGEAPDPSMWDVVRVPSSADELVVLEEGGETPLSELGGPEQPAGAESSGPFGDV